MLRGVGRALLTPLCFSRSNPLPACLLCALSLSALGARIADKAFYQQPDADVIGYVYVPLTDYPAPQGLGVLASALTAQPRGGGDTGRYWALAKFWREDDVVEHL